MSMPPTGSKILWQKKLNNHQTYMSNISVYSLVVRGHGDPVLGPLAGEVDAHARHDGRRVAQAHRRQVQAANARASMV